MSSAPLRSLFGRSQESMEKRHILAPNPIETSAVCFILRFCDLFRLRLLTLTEICAVKIFLYVNLLVCVAVFLYM